MDRETMEVLASVFTAIGTVAVAILAIWGDWFRDRVAGPKLEICLRSKTGDLTVTNVGQRQIYFHIVVKNKRVWAPAESVRVRVMEISKRQPDGGYFPEDIVTPLQLTWAFPQFHELLPTITSEQTCDLGYLAETAGQFSISTYIKPNNFRGFIRANEGMRVVVVAEAHNGRSNKLTIEISWDGLWTPNPGEMQRHCVVKEVPR